MQIVMKLHRETCFFQAHMDDKEIESRHTSDKSSLTRATEAHWNLPGHSMANLRVTVLEQSKYNNEEYRKERGKRFIIFLIPLTMESTGSDNILCFIFICTHCDQWTFFSLLFRTYPVIFMTNPVTIRTNAVILGPLEINIGTETDKNRQKWTKTETDRNRQYWMEMDRNKQKWTATERKGQQKKSSRLGHKFSKMFEIQKSGT